MVRVSEVHIVFRIEDGGLVVLPSHLSTFLYTIECFTRVIKDCEASYHPVMPLTA